MVTLILLGLNSQKEKMMKSQKIIANGVGCNLHFAILDAGPTYLRSDLISNTNRKAVVLSVYDRSKENCMGFWANIHKGISNSSYRSLCDVHGDVYTNEIIPLTMGKEFGYHMMAYTSGIGKNTFICHKDKILDGLYSLCMNNIDLPLLREWMEPLLGYAIGNKLASVGHTIIGLTNEEREEDIIIDLKENGGKVPLSEIEVVTFNCAEEEWIMSALKDLHDSGQVFISSKKQKSIESKTLDEYLAAYGVSMVDNLKKVVKPLTELSGNIENVALKKLRLFPQQIAQVNGGQKLLDHENFLILNEGMGTGKTIQSISIVEGRENQKYMDTHPGTTLKDCLVKGRVKYRAIIMCPGHLPEKWAREVETNVPFAKATVLKTFNDIVALRKMSKEPQGKEFYVIGKDFCKLSYQSRPVPKIVKIRPVLQQVCSSCGSIRANSRGTEPCKCGCNTWVANKHERVLEGMVCPSCGELLWPYVGNPQVLNEEKIPLMPEDFAEQRESNSYCYYCGNSLWEPCVGNIDTDVLNVTGLHAPVSKWHKISHYTNARCNATKTVWVHDDYEDRYLASVGKAKLDDVSVVSARKYSPAKFIKKYLKNFFNYGLFDEAHLYKGGATAQGNAFASIASVCEKQLLLTGTIANGYANALFYLLFRVAPNKLRSLGFNWYDEMKFVAKYGTLETQYDADDSWGEGTYNKSSKGRQLTQPKVRPGISPLLMLDLLLPYQLTLDLSDMSKFLPPLKEYVVSVEPDEEMISEYRYNVQSLKKLIRSKEGKTIMGTMLQFALSYPDKPYGRSAITSAIDGSILAEPEDLSFLIDNDGLLEKEKKLIETVKKEISEGRNSVVYAEYTNSKETIVTQRIRYVLEKNIPELKGKVEILESSSPKAIKREAWIHDKARKGTKVFITNPRCVETGLDFVWTEKTDKGEKLYNFPTLIFYQTGYNLYTVWQASRRHYRLCQTEECRTYYFAYKNTVQMEVLQILAEKQTATSAIQGKFSAEGLAKMAHQVDPRVKLAQSLCEADSVNLNELQEMFDVLNDVNNTVGESEKELLDGYQPMLLFSEIITDGETEAITDVIAGDEVTGKKESTFEKFLRISSEDGLIAWGTEFQRTTKENAVETLGTTEGKGKKKSIEGQMDLFSLAF